MIKTIEVCKGFMILNIFIHKDTPQLYFLHDEEYCRIVQKLHHPKFSHCISKLEFPLLRIDEMNNATFLNANI